MLAEFSSLNATVRMSMRKMRRSLRFRNNQITEERVNMTPQKGSRTCNGRSCTLELTLDLVGKPKEYRLLGYQE